MASERRFDLLMSRLDAPLSVVTTAAGAERAGCLVGFHAQCSIEPSRYALWLSKANHTYRVGLHAEHLAVHFLDRADTDLAELFGSTSGDEADKFERCAWHRGPGAVPVLDRCHNRMVLRRRALLDEGGDHVCVVTEPVEVSTGEPFVALRVSDVGHLVPGHQARERPPPSTLRTGAGP